MKSRSSADFWACYHGLSAEARRRADRNYRLFRENPGHPSLRFKRLEGAGDCWSVRVGDHYRAVGVRERDTIIWFWIGTHNEFDKRF